MPVVLFVLVALGLLLLILIQDLKDRAVTWFLFPALALVCYFYSARLLSHAAVWQNWLLNIGFLACELAFISLYLMLKHRKLVWPMQGYMGWGDVCFWVAAAFLFPLPNFAVYFLVSLLFSLIIHLWLRHVSGFYAQKHTVPLAGFQALFLAGLFLVQIFVPALIFTDEFLVVGLFL
ncbi:hypothetical protein [Adhaeribacter soli]|uniref:Prepilin type IV endopeptidase peptidase domain-containing protein n=1 Tax=Adhaeribacter soli TaxID=2607655 RepID=A0A5N1IJS8_9BACT|nr:hypothetical protein [Adhaeribacter soli]KAA9324914.1 hypothetical protein F0P94_19505 [Adhaeribacter soli]